MMEAVTQHDSQPGSLVTYAVLCPCHSAGTAHPCTGSLVEHGQKGCLVTSALCILSLCWGKEQECIDSLGHDPGFKEMTVEITDTRFLCHSL